MDMYKQHLNQAQPEAVGGAFHGASGGFQFTGGPTSTRGGPSANRYNNFASFVLGMPNNTGKTILTPDEYKLRMSLYSLYIRDRWNVTPNLTLSYGVRWEYFPVPVRPDRGIERYDPTTNTMLICGVGGTPEGLWCQCKRQTIRTPNRTGVSSHANVRDSRRLRYYQRSFSRFGIATSELSDSDSGEHLGYKFVPAGHNARERNSNDSASGYR